MKKLLACVLLLAFTAQSFAATVLPSETPKALKNAKEIMIPVGKTGKTISMYELAKISTADFEKLSGKSFSKKEHNRFVKAQKQLNKSINTEGVITNKRLARAMAGDTGFHLGGFALGFLGLLGVLLAYVAFNDENKQNRIKWAWIGFGTFVLLYILLLVVLL